MNAFQEIGLLMADQSGGNATEDRARREFRTQFKREVLQRVRQGFTVEECFGLVWEEVLDVVCLPDSAQGSMYDELIAWAKNRCV